MPAVDRVRSLVGVADRGDDPAVVALVAPGRLPCAGALVAPDVVLTAGLCVPPSVPALRIFTGERPAGAVERARGYRLFAASPENAGVAFVQLDQPIDEIEPVAIRATGAAKGDHVRTVGFAAAGKVVRDHVAVLGTSAGAFDVDEASCVAARGSPALDESTGEIAGVLASAGADCVPGSGRDVYERTDLARAAVEQALSQANRGTQPRAEKTKKGPIDMGSACLRGAECAAGACVAYASAEYCSRTCDGQDACPARFKCMNTQEEVTVCVER